MLIEIAEDNSINLLQETLDLFIKENQSVLHELEKGVFERDLDWLRWRVHHISGSASNIGLFRVFVECKNIENQIESGDFTKSDLNSLHQKISALCNEGTLSYQKFIDTLKK